jgi:hypothetical protein
MALGTIRMGRLTCLQCEFFVLLRRGKWKEIGADTQRRIEFDDITQQNPGMEKGDS